MEEGEWQQNGDWWLAPDGTWMSPDMVTEWYNLVNLKNENLARAQELAKQKPLKWSDWSSRYPKRHQEGQVEIKVRSLTTDCKPRTSKRPVLPDNHPLVLHCKKC